MVVERIEQPQRDNFWRRFVETSTPVVLTGTMTGSPLAHLVNRELAIAELGRMPLVVRPEYSRSLLSTLKTGPNTSHEPETMSLRSYFRVIRDNPSTSRMCIEEPTPPELAELTPVPPICTGNDGKSDPFLKSTIFVGNAGNCAPLHYDGDSRHVLLYQVFGCKRVTVIPAVHGAALRPIANFSTLRWSKCPPNERHDILGRLGGVETVIGPGQAMFIPALAYHAVDYLEDGMSVNFRFGRNRYHELFSAHVHLDPNAQRLMAASADEKKTEIDFAETYRQIVGLLCTGTPTSWIKRNQMVALLSRLAADLGDGAQTEIESEAFVQLPEVVEQALHRAHLFKEQLYRQRAAIEPSALEVPIPGLTARR